MSHNIPLGQKISRQDSPAKDAIHIAISPAKAWATLQPGEPVGFVWDGDTETVGGIGDMISKEPIGIVDPFLKEGVNEGDRFYVCLYPNTVTNLRHDWEHPAFKASNLDESKKYLENVAATCGLRYDRLISAMTDFAESGEDYHMGNNEDYNDVEDWETAWMHWAKVTGKEVPEDAWCPFSCAC